MFERSRSGAAALAAAGAIIATMGVVDAGAVPWWATTALGAALSLAGAAVLYLTRTEHRLTKLEGRNPNREAKP